MNEIIIKSFWYVCAVCLVVWIALHQYLIPRMKRISPDDFQKAGKPSRFWSDHRTVAFIFYILSRKYEGFPDEKMVVYFRLARLTILIWVASFAVFIFVCIQ